MPYFRFRQLKLVLSSVGVRFSGGEQKIRDIEKQLAAHIEFGVTANGTHFFRCRNAFRTVCDTARELARRGHLKQRMLLNGTELRMTVAGDAGGGSTKLCAWLWDDERPMSPHTAIVLALYDGEDAAVSAEVFGPVFDVLSPVRSDLQAENLLPSAPTLADMQIRQPPDPAVRAKYRVFLASHPTAPQIDPQFAVSRTCATCKAMEIDGYGPIPYSFVPYEKLRIIVSGDMQFLLEHFVGAQPASSSHPCPCCTIAKIDLYTPAANITVNPPSSVMPAVTRPVVPCVWRNSERSMASYAEWSAVPPHQQKKRAQYFENQTRPPLTTFHGADIAPSPLHTITGLVQHLLNWVVEGCNDTDRDNFEAGTVQWCYAVLSH
jgi:hypothetical protein